jgi:hypothetical protein
MFLIRSLRLSWSGSSPWSVAALKMAVRAVRGPKCTRLVHFFQISSVFDNGLVSVRSPWIQILLPANHHKAAMVSISPAPVPLLSMCCYIACTDVVKKPKLDHHYAQCRNSFTCIDCSQTFNSPAEWKAHTSCVTEAEKYQKSLYTGPKKVRRVSRSPSCSAHKRVPQGSRPDKARKPTTMNAPGKYHQSSGTQSGWSRQQYTRNCASGANSTPLGSPLRMSPVDSSAVEPSTTAGAVVVCLSNTSNCARLIRGCVEPYTEWGGAEWA